MRPLSIRQFLRTTLHRLRGARLRRPRVRPATPEALEPRVLLDATLVRDINPSASVGSRPSYLTDVNGTLYFAANDGTTDTELWKSDGTSAGTVLVRDILPGAGGSSNPANLTNVNGTLYFSAYDFTTGYELWKSNGTSTGTVLVRDIRSVGSSAPANLTNVNGTLYFTANDGTTGVELWKSDGTESGTMRVLDIRSGSLGSSPSNLTNVNGTLYFRAYDGTTGIELWQSDGTSSGTVRVMDIRPGSSGSNPSNLTNVNGTLYFTADDGTHGTELWKCNGTSAQPVMVSDIRDSGGSSTPKYLTNVNGTLYFQADDGPHGEELWKSDGTSTGTLLVRDIWNSYSSSPSSLTNVNGTLYFRVDDGTHDIELWKSDGTSTGTVLVRDIHPSANSAPANLTNVNGTLYFQANDGSTGIELWQSDGTSAGTVLVRDIRLGQSSNPTFLTNVNGTLYFQALDSSTGDELWKLPPNSPPTDLTLSATVIAENQPSGTAVGTFSTTDPDTADTFTYTLVSGDGSADNASFTIDGATLKTAASFNFENKSSYSIRVRTTDSGAESFEKQFTITVSNVNEPPVNLTLSASSIAENQPVGTTVGVFTATDPDAGTTLTYSLVSGAGSTDNASFTIDGNTLKTAASFDFETKSSYSIRARVSDGILTAEQQFTITVTNVNEPPANLTLSASLIAENQPVGTTVGVFTATDQDAGTTLTYSLVSGAGSTDNASFTIDGNTLKTAASFDFETKSSYSIRARVSDGILTTEQQFTITVTDGNDGATQVVLSNVVTSLLATANTTSAIPLADVSITDDGLGTNTLSLSGADAGVFEVVSNQLRLKAGTVLNYATQKTYAVTMNVDDTTVGGTPDASVNYTLSLQGLDGLTVQNGSAGRSYVRSVTLNFGTSQGLADIASSLTTATPRVRLVFAGTTGTQSINKSLTSLVTVVGNTLRIDFGVNGVGGDRNSSLGDGVYRLRVDLDGDGTLESTRNFHRLFGDVDGNGVVDDADIALVQNAQSQTGLNLATDLNGDGLVDLTDLTNVKRRKGAKVAL